VGLEEARSTLPPCAISGCVSVLQPARAEGEQESKVVRKNRDRKTRFMSVSSLVRTPKLVPSLPPSRRSEVEENPSNVITEMRNERCIPYIDSTCAIEAWTRDKYSNS